MASDKWAQPRHSSEWNTLRVVFQSVAGIRFQKPWRGVFMIRRRSTTRSLAFCGLEVLESRKLMSSGIPSRQASSFVYTETDNSNPGQNAVIAYKQSASGQVTEIGSFNTGGTGVANAPGLLGPDDSDKEVIASSDGHLLFAVNQGSNTVAVFRVRNNGSLALVNGAAFNSGGTEPVSLSIDGNRLYVVNRGDEIQGQTGSIAPSITVFKIEANGVLKQDFADTTTLPAGLSPSQLLISPASHLAFLDTFTPPPLNNVTDANEILPFQIASNGSLVPVSSGGLRAPVSPPLLLGLALAPSQNVIYAGLTATSKVGVFTFDGAGDLSLAGTVATQGAVARAGPWSAPTASSFTRSTRARTAWGSSRWRIRWPRFKFRNSCSVGRRIRPAIRPRARETTDFEFALSPSGNTLYVIDHQSDAAGTFPQGNALHVLSVATDGTLSESASSPLFLPSNIPAGLIRRVSR